MRVPTVVRPEDFIEAAQALGRHGWELKATELYDALVAWDQKTKFDKFAMLKTADVAKRLGVSPQYVRRMCEDGRLPAVRLGKAQYRIPAEGLEQLARGAGK